MTKLKVTAANGSAKKENPYTSKLGLFIQVLYDDFDKTNQPLPILDENNQPMLDTWVGEVERIFQENIGDGKGGIGWIECDENRYNYLYNSGNEQSEYIETRQAYRQLPIVVKSGLDLVEMEKEIDEPKSEIDLKSNLTLYNLHARIVRSMLSDNYTFSREISTMGCIYDYLRSISIALPITVLTLNGEPKTISVQEQVELGLIKLKGGEK